MSMYGQSLFLALYPIYPEMATRMIMIRIIRIQIHQSELSLLPSDPPEPEPLPDPEPPSPDPPPDPDPPEPPEPLPEPEPDDDPAVHTAYSVTLVENEPSLTRVMVPAEWYSGVVASGSVDHPTNVYPERIGSANVIVSVALAEEEVYLRVAGAPVPPLAS